MIKAGYNGSGIADVVRRIHDYQFGRYPPRARRQPIGVLSCSMRPQGATDFGRYPPQSVPNPLHPLAGQNFALAMEASSKRGKIVSQSEKQQYYTCMESLFRSEKRHMPWSKVALCKKSVTAHQICRRLTLTVAATVLAFTPMACGQQQSKAPAATPAETPAETPASHARPDSTALSGSGTFTSPDPASKAITYNPSLAPVDAAVLASIIPPGYGYSRTVATLVVAGLLPNRSYAVHAHTNACGLTGEDAGPYYQNRIDPAARPPAPSTNPRYASPRNEIWLDIRTDAAGQGTSQTTVPFGFTDRRPGSIVLHEATTTATAPGQAGEAGAPIACVTLLPSQ